MHINTFQGNLGKMKCPGVGHKQVEKPSSQKAQVVSLHCGKQCLYLLQIKNGSQQTLGKIFNLKTIENFLQFSGFYENILLS